MGTVGLSIVKCNPVARRQHKALPHLRASRWQATAKLQSVTQRQSMPLLHHTCLGWVTLLNINLVPHLGEVVRGGSCVHASVQPAQRGRAMLSRAGQSCLPHARQHGPALLHRHISVVVPVYKFALRHCHLEAEAPGSVCSLRRARCASMAACLAHGSMRLRWRGNHCLKMIGPGPAAWSSVRPVSRQSQGKVAQQKPAPAMHLQVLRCAASHAAGSDTASHCVSRSSGHAMALCDWHATECALGKRGCEPASWQRRRRRAASRAAGPLRRRQTRCAPRR